MLNLSYKRVLILLIVLLIYQLFTITIYSKNRDKSGFLSTKKINIKAVIAQNDDGLLVGFNGRTYSPSVNSPNTILPISPNGYNYNTERIWYVNGILNKLEDQVETMKEIANKSGQPVIGIRNSSYGFPIDALQTILDLQGSPYNPATKTLTDLVYKELKNNHEVHLFGHSQGTVIINNAIENVRKKLETDDKFSFCEILNKLSLIKAEIYGSPNYEFVNGPAYVHACNYLDPVCNFLQLKDNKLGDIGRRYLLDQKIEREIFFSDISITSTQTYGAKAYINNLAKNVGSFNPHNVLKYIEYFRNQTVQFPIPPACDSAYLYLIDTSGSMGNAGKLESAKQSAQDSLKNLEKRSEDKSRFSPASVFSFAGGCSESSTQKLIDFTMEVNQIAKDLPSRLPSANGETPLPQAINVASKTMEEYMAKYNFIKEGYIVVLSDGESTCGPVRPSGTWGNGKGANINLGYSFPVNTKFLTLGFALAPGSIAERDLQYLAFASGGKYYNAADSRQLSRGFQKLTQSYYPKSILLTDSRSPKFNDALNKAGIALQKKRSAEALKLYRQLETDFKRDAINSPELYFNLAQALEASDRYKGAVEYYQRYLQSNPQAADKAIIEQKIATLKQDHKDQFEYHLKIIESDLAYLKKFYGDLFNKQNNVLAPEFAGFVTEKGEFYTNLQDILEVQDKNLKNHSKDLSDGLYELANKVKSGKFDQEAISLLTIPISELEEILELLKKDKAKFMTI